MKLAQKFNHDFEGFEDPNGCFRLFDSNGNEIYFEISDGYWEKRECDSNGNQISFKDSSGYWSKYEYDSNGNEIYFEDSDGDWEKREYDSNGNKIYYENSYGLVFDRRPTSSRNGKVVEIDGKKYELKEV